MTDPSSPDRSSSPSSLPGALAGALDGKVALVTGTSPNIGGVLASGLAAAGARVACNDVVEATAADRVARIEAAGGEALAVPFDVTDPDGVAAGVAAVLERWGQIDVLVNCAVRFDTMGILDMPVERFRRQIDIILGGAFLVTQAVARSMVERGVAGSIINILSTAAWQGQAGNVGYSTGKSRADQLHPLGGHGAGPPRDPGQRVHPHRHHARRAGAGQPVPYRRRAGHRGRHHGLRAARTRGPGCPPRRTTWAPWCSSPPTPPP